MENHAEEIKSDFADNGVDQASQGSNPDWCGENDNNQEFMSKIQ